MFCLMCGDVWVGDDRLMLIQGVEQFYIDGDKFICPLCYDFFRDYDAGKKEHILNSHPEIEHLEGRKVCKNCKNHNPFTWKCLLKNELTLLHDFCEQFEVIK